MYQILVYNVSKFSTALHVTFMGKRPHSWVNLLSGLKGFYDSKAIRIFECVFYVCENKYMGLC